MKKFCSSCPFPPSQTCFQNWMVAAATALYLLVTMKWLTA